MEKIPTDQEIAQRELTYHTIEASWHNLEVARLTAYLAAITGRIAICAETRGIHED